MNRAYQIVNELLEASQVRVCANCEANQIKKGLGALSVPVGYTKSHGFCRRHYIAMLDQDPALALDSRVQQALKRNDFCPDLGH